MKDPRLERELSRALRGGRPKAKPKVCGTPHKVRFANLRTAEKVGFRAVVPLRPYLCGCGWFHLTKGQKSKGRIKGLSDAQVQQVTDLDDTDFTILVAADLEGHSVPESKALRAPQNLDRWANTLKAVVARIELELERLRHDESPETDERRSQCRATRSKAEIALGEVRELRRREAERAQAAKARTRTESAQSTHARLGRQATKALVELHHGDFIRLLLTEYEVAAEPAPDGVLEYGRQYGLVPEEEESRVDLP